MKKFIVTGLAVILTFVGFAFINNETATASSVLPKSFRGYWTSKPQYTYQRKHVNKNMAVPRVAMKVTAKTATWHFYGYLPSGYNRKTYKLKLKNGSKNWYVMTGHGPYRTINFLSKNGSKLFLSYQGGGIDLIRHK